MSQMKFNYASFLALQKLLNFMKQFIDQPRSNNSNHEMNEVEIEIFRIKKC